MASEGLLAQIANPRAAQTIGQAMDYREQRMAMQAEQERKRRLGEMVAESIPHLREGSKLKMMAMEDPESFMAFTKAMGIPVNQGQQLQQFEDDIWNLSNMAAQDPNQAFEYANSIIAERGQMGLDAPQLQQFVELAQQDPNKAYNALNVLNQSVNSDRIEAAQMARDKAELDRRKLEAQIARYEKGEVQDGSTANIKDLEYWNKNWATKPESDEKKAAAIKLGLSPSYSLDPEIQRQMVYVKESEKGNVGRKNEYIDQGTIAAQSVPVLRRSLSLLEEMETGGIDKVATKSKQLFGIESADEGELSYLLAKNVLGQLKATFGAAFTNEEAKRLESIEANIGRSPAANKRIIQQALQISNKKAIRGIEAAEGLDDFAAEDIRSLMEMDLTPKKTTKTSREDLDARLKSLGG